MNALYPMPILISVALSILLLICPGFVRGFSIPLDLVLSHIAYFSAVFFMSRKYPKQKGRVVISFIASIVAVYSLICISLGKLLTFTLPSFISIVIACTNGYLFFTARQRATKVALLSFSASLCTFSFF